MTDKYTPGPWGTYERLSSSENHRGYVLTAPAHKPSSHRIAIGELLPMDSDGNEGRANAALAAAAPLMLEALRDALNELETLVRCDNTNDPVTNATTDMRIDKVRAAIAAATGE